jgi:hypothetical protein
VVVPKTIPKMGIKTARPTTTWTRGVRHAITPLPC